MSNNEGVMDALSEVIDPEMGISVTDLGLIYGVENQEGHLEVTMTLTSPGCPCLLYTSPSPRDEL